MFDFHWPWMALLIPLPLLVRWLWPREVSVLAERPVESSQITLLHPSFSHLQYSFGSGTPHKRLGGRIYLLLLLLCWLSLVTSLMRPQWLVPETQIKSQGYDLMLAVDTSRSMTALDFTRDGQPVSRMAVVKGVMDRFISERGGDRVGLVIFGTLAYVQAPLTLDLEAIRRILAEVTPGMAGDATAMGDAMGLAIKKLRDRPPGSRVLLLITDGDNTSGIIPPLQAAALAAREGVRIYTIGVGSDQTEVPMLGSDGRYQIENDAGMKEDILIEISRQTGGAYFRATNTLALEEISLRINELEKSQVETSSILVPRPLYRWPLSLALFTLLLIGLFPEGRVRTSGASSG